MSTRRTDDRIELLQGGADHDCGGAGRHGSAAGTGDSGCNDGGSRLRAAANDRGEPAGAIQRHIYPCAHRPDPYFAQPRRADSGLQIGVAGAVPVSGRPGYQSSVQPSGGETHFRCRLLPLTAPGAAVLELRLRSGRWAADDSRALEAVVNDTLARQMWPGWERGRPLANLCRSMT